jgi:ABC-type molybdate transport system substrate-binding protein
MKLFKHVVILLLGTILSLISCQKAPSEKIVIATAANMRLPLEAIAKRFTPDFRTSIFLKT